ncbi:MAG TPA: hypothetical protein VG326_01785 [Tepidisphaeraceae bacterium]|jgi:anti-sigma factor RsiW|nr:hypothetical protein [Tepidisphaeraceae bacterium]
MMNDADLDLLEAYLDDALSATEVERLDRRLTSEASLSAALDQLRRERAARIAFFHAQAPNFAQADEFADRFISSMRRKDRRVKFAGGARVGAGIAACLLVGFTVGWIGHGRATRSQAVAPAAEHSDVRLAAHTPKPAEAGPFQVAILDEDGNVIALQRFSKLEDARQFADDLAQYQVRRQQVQDGQAMLVSDKF